MSDLSWDAASLRLTIFPTEPSDDALARAWWDRVVGAEPDTTVSERLEAKVTRTSQLEGPDARAVRLVMQQTPSRTDWILLPPEPWEDGLLTIGPFDAASDWFRERMLVWLDEPPAAFRMAYAPVLVMLAGSLAESTARVADLVKVSVDPETTSDFVFRINRRKASAVIPDVQINRVAAWSSLSVRRGSLSLIDGLTTDTQVAFATRLEADLNNVPVESPLAPDRLVALMDELIEMSRQLAEEGDIR